MIAFPQSISQLLQGGTQLFPCRWTEQVVLVAEVLFPMPQEQLAVLDVTRRKHVDLIEASIGQALRLPIQKRQPTRLPYNGSRHLAASALDILFRSSLRFKHLNKCFLRNIDSADAFHAFLSFFLFLQQFPFPRDIAAVAFRGHVFSQGGNALARNNFPTDCGLNRDLVKLTWNYFL